MTLVTVLPTSTISGSSNFTVTGAASPQAALSDGLDTSYVVKNSGVGTQSLVVGFAAATIAATEVVKRVRLRYRVTTPTSAGKLNCYLGTRIGSSNIYENASTVRGLNSIATFIGAWFPAAPDGSAWDQTRITNLRALISDYMDTTDKGTFYDLMIDIDKATQPTVSVTAPTGTVTTATPDVGWTYTDPDNADAQSFYQVRVFTSAQAGIGGFNAATSPATWDSGQVGSGDNLVTIGAGLLSGAYVAYVRVGKSINGAPYWSTYSSTSFTVSVTPPTVPTLVGSWTAGLGYATLTITGAAAGAYASQFYEVQRSDDGGVTFNDIRNGASVTPNGSYIGTVSDYEAPRTLTVQYRARAVGVSATGAQTPSAWSTVQLILVTSDGTWWIKAPLQPSINVGGVLVQMASKGNIAEPQTVFRPIGVSLPTVVAGTIGGRDGEYTIMATTTAQATALYAILKYQGSLLIQDPLGRQKYIRLTDRTWDESALGQVLRQGITVKYVEVAS